MTERAETGPVRFGDDWPGVFFRGDDAHSCAIAISEIAARLDTDPRPAGNHLLAYQKLDALRMLLSSCEQGSLVAPTQLRPWAACTEGGHAEPPRDRAALAAAVAQVSDALNTWHEGEPDERQLRSLRPEMKKFFDLLIAMLEVSGR